MSLRALAYSTIATTAATVPPPTSASATWSSYQCGPEDPAVTVLVVELLEPVIAPSVVDALPAPALPVPALPVPALAPEPLAVAPLPVPAFDPWSPLCGPAPFLQASIACCAADATSGSGLVARNRW